MDKHERSALSIFWGDEGAALIASPKFEAREMSHSQKLVLRGDNSVAFRTVVEACTGTPLPHNENDLAGDDPCCMVIGKDEWLISSANRQALDRELAATLQNTHSTVFDVRSAWVILELSGNNVRSLLARGCEQDLHRAKFPPGRFIRANVIGIPVFLYHQVEANKIDLYVDRSLAMDLWLWLRDTAKEMTI